APAAGLLAYLAQAQMSTNVIIQKEKPSAPLIVGGRSSSLWVDGTMNGRRYKSLALVTTADVGYGAWMVYLSYATAPAERFEMDMPLMQEIWNSWTIHPGVFRERLNAARRSNAETYRIWRDTMEYHNRVYERANDAWDRVIRGV